MITSIFDGIITMTIFTRDHGSSRYFVVMHDVVAQTVLYLRGAGRGIRVCIAVTLFFISGLGLPTGAIAQPGEQNSISGLAQPSARAMAAAAIRSPTILTIDRQGAHLFQSDGAMVPVQSVSDMRCDMLSERLCTMIVFNMP